MTDAPFISLDARYLAELAQRLPDTMLADVVRLSEIAKRHERLDEQVRNLSSGDSYAQGRMDMALEIYSRSNLPVEERTPQKALEIDPAKIRKIPRGVSGIPIKPEGPAPLKFGKAAKPKKASPIAGLSIVLDLSKFRKDKA